MTHKKPGFCLQMTQRLTLNLTDPSEREEGRAKPTFQGLEA